MPELGHSFSENEFAQIIGRFEGVDIRTDRPINWESTGTHQLTPEEITALRQTYDITNLTPQEYYNLMADLSSMDVITAEEAVSKYLYQSDTPHLGGMYGIFMFGDFTPHGDFRFDPIGNLMKTLQNAQTFYASAIDYTKSGELARVNAYVLDDHPDATAMFLETYQAAYDFNERLISIFCQLLPEGSPWALSHAVSSPANEYVPLPEESVGSHDKAFANPVPLLSVPLPHVLAGLRRAQVSLDDFWNETDGYDRHIVV